MQQKKQPFFIGPLGSFEHFQRLEGMDLDEKQSVIFGKRISMTV